MRPLPRSFYARPTVAVARDLLGKVLVREAGGARMSGTIAETEAYGHADDPASHAFGGMTARNGPMFGEVGRAYVYFTYGMHHCLNAVARGRGRAAGAVLIRAVEPEEGAAEMAANRGRGAARGIADGPAKLTQAMRITAEQCGEDLAARGGLFIAAGPGPGRISASPRVGISRGTAALWNFRAAGPRRRSRRPASTARPGRVSAPSRA